MTGRCWLLIALCCLCFAGTNAQQHTIPPWTLCSGVIDYQVMDLPDPNTCDAFRDQSTQLLNITLQVLSDPCREVYAKYVCSKVWKQESGDNAPLELCTAASVCSLKDNGTIIALHSKAGATVSLPWPPTCGASTNAVTFKSPLKLLYPRCEPYAGTICKGVVTWDVYVPALLQQKDQENGLKAAIPLLNNAPRSTGCANSLLKALCARTFPKCQIPTFSGNQTAALGTLKVYFPGYMDQTVCADVFDGRCGALAAKVPFTCNTTVAVKSGCNTSDSTQSVELNWVDLSPTGVTTLLFGSPPTAIDVASIKNELDGNIAAAVDFPCPAPLQSVRGSQVGLNDGSCGLPCPSILFEQSQYDQSDKVMLGLTFVSFFLTVYMLFTYILFKSARKSYFAIIEVVMLFFITWTLFFAVAAPASSDDRVQGVYAKMSCVDAVTPRQDGYCRWMAVVMVLCGMGAANYWFIQSTDLFLQIQFKARTWRPKTQMIKNVIFHSWGLGYPVVAMIIGLGADRMGNSQTGIPWCFITDSNLAWGIFYGPIFAQCIIGAIFMMFILRTIFLSAKATGAHKGKGKWLIYIRPVSFVVTFLFVWVFVFAYRLNERGYEETYKSDTSAFAKCLLSGGSEATCTVRARPNFGLWIAVQAVIAGVGVWVWIVYNTMDNFRMWAAKLTCKDYDFDKTNTENSQSSQKDPPSRQGSKKKLTASGSSTEMGTSTSKTDLGVSKGGLKYSSNPPPADADAPPVLMGPAMTGLPDLDKADSGDVVRFSMRSGSAEAQVQHSSSTDQLTANA